MNELVVGYLERSANMTPARHTFKADCRELFGNTSQKLLKIKLSMPFSRSSIKFGQDDYGNGLSGLGFYGLCVNLNSNRADG
jgi:hypothetical protein